MKLMLTFVQVNRSVVEAARLLYHLDLHEQKFLKLLCGSIQEFVDVSPVTKDWSLLKFVTALKFYCYPGGRFQIWRPSKVTVICLDALRVCMRRTTVV